MSSQTDIGKVDKMFHNKHDHNHHESDQKRQSYIEQRDQNNHHNAYDTGTSEIGSTKMRGGNKGGKAQNCPEN
ncbi:hypothetical protein EMIT036CA2_40058 [Chryseobacterium sp. IT-36CA2]